MFFILLSCYLSCCQLVIGDDETMIFDLLFDGMQLPFISFSNILSLQNIENQTTMHEMRGFPDSSLNPDIHLATFSFDKIKRRPKLLFFSWEYFSFLKQIRFFKLVCYIWNLQNLLIVCTHTLKSVFLCAKMLQSFVHSD